VTKSPPGIFFVVMNYSVHASMYFYYFLMAARMRPKWFNPMIITAMQISQMGVGVAVTLAGFYFYKTDPTCSLEAENNTAAFIMYGSYLFLFMQFFVGRYCATSVKKVKTV
jgi:elongation of very long chain fatty acids protein 6